VKKPTAFIETMTNPSEATCCEAPCGVAGKPECVEFDINAPGAKAKQKTSSAEFSDASGSGDSSGSNGSNKHLLWLLLLIPLLCCLIPLLLWLCWPGAKKKKKVASRPLTKEPEEDPVPPLVKGAVPQYGYAPVATTPMTTGVLYPIQNVAMPSFRSAATTQGGNVTVAFDTSGDGRANFTVTGPDRNHDGIPDALQDPTYRAMQPAAGIGAGRVPRATFGIDTIGDGRANLYLPGSQVVASPIPSLGPTVSPRSSNPGYALLNPALSPRNSPRLSPR
jgi:hypothetical protein